MFACSLQAQVSESEYKVAFIERFTRFIEWPDSIKSDTFNIVIVGKTPLQSTLNELFTNIKIKNRDVRLIYSKDSIALINANLVFIAGSEKRRIEKILTVTNKYPILTISDSKGYGTKGVHINMYNDDNYIRYEINQESIKNSKLIVNSLLLASAKIVRTND